jgi:hypothetical protein
MKKRVTTGAVALMLALSVALTGCAETKSKGKKKSTCSSTSTSSGSSGSSGSSSGREDKKKQGSIPRRGGRR